MKYILALALCFVFGSLAAGQGYGRRRTPQKKPIVLPKPVFNTQPVIHPKPAVQNPFVDEQWMNPIQALSGRGRRLPADIESILGSTITGGIIEGGKNEFPLHGGSGTDPNGLRQGWGADPFEPFNPAVSNWNSPMGNAAYPTNYQGEELIYDAATNRYVYKHQQNKKTQYTKPQQGHIMPGRPFTQSSHLAEHNIVKEANHMANKAIGGISPVVVNPVGHHVEKKIVGEQMHNVDKIQNHNIVKPSGIISAGKPSYLRRGPNNAGVVGHNNPALISHNIDKATLGANSIIGHNIAKSSGPAVGVGFINPNGHVAGKMSGGAMLGGAMLGTSIDGSFAGMSHTGPGVFPEDPVHSVHKVSKSGVAAMGHDPLARNIGHGIAKQVIGESANAVNIGSNGGVSAGNPVAIAATHGLAKESLHVAGKTLNIASESNPIRPGGPIGVGNNIFGGIHPKPIHPKPFHPKPVVKPQPKFQTGYGRRRKF